MKEVVREINARFNKEDTAKSLEFARQVQDEVSNTEKQNDSLRYASTEASVDALESWEAWIGGLAFALTAIAASIATSSTGQVSYFTVSGIVIYAALGTVIALSRKEKAEKQVRESFKFLVETNKRHREHSASNIKYIRNPGDAFLYLDTMRKARAVHRIEVRRLEQDLKKLKAARTSYRMDGYIATFVIGLWVIFRPVFEVTLNTSRNGLVDMFYWLALSMVLAYILVAAVNSAREADKAHKVNIVDVKSKLKFGHEMLAYISEEIRPLENMLSVGASELRKAKLQTLDVKRVSGSED